MKKAAFGLIAVLALASASFAPVTAATDAPLLVPGYPAASDIPGAKELPDPHMDYKVVFADGQEAKSKSDINPMLPSIAQYLNTLGKYGVPAAHRHIVIMFHQRNPDMDIVMTNEASKRIFQQFRGAADSANVMRTVFDPRGLRPFIVNWEEVAECLMHSIHRQVAAQGSEAVIKLRDELLAYPGVPSRLKAAETMSEMPPLVAMQLRNGDLSMAFFGMVTMFATPRDVALQQLKIECFFPADAATEQTARRLAAAAAQPVAV